MRMEERKRKGEKMSDKAKKKKRPQMKYCDP